MTAFRKRLPKRTNGNRFRFGEIWEAVSRSNRFRFGEIGKPFPTARRVSIDGRVSRHAGVWLIWTRETDEFGSLVADARGSRQCPPARPARAGRHLPSAAQLAHDHSPGPVYVRPHPVPALHMHGSHPRSSPLARHGHGCRSSDNALAAA